MNERANGQMVRQLYACFAQGDIAGALGLLSEDVDWQVAGPSDLIPWAGPRRGHVQVAHFFTLRPDTLEVQQFEPTEFVAQGDTVVVLGREQARVKPTDRTCESDWAMVFTLRDGKIARIREYTYSAAWAAAYAAPARA